MAWILTRRLDQHMVRTLCQRNLEAERRNAKAFRPESVSGGLEHHIRQTENVFVFSTKEEALDYKATMDIYKAAAKEIHQS